MSMLSVIKITILSKGTATIKIGPNHCQPLLHAPSSSGATEESFWVSRAILSKRKESVQAIDSKRESSVRKPQYAMASASP
jgi:hypothetical protein